MSVDKNLKEVFNLLKKTQKTLSFVESCTGGGLAKEITSLSGASDFFRGGLVPYQDQVKSELLLIDESLIEEKTAVCSEVVLKMAQAGSSLFKSDWCLATSGWAGPGGGTSDDPVGTVYFAVVGPGHESVERRTFSGSNTREEVVEEALKFAWEFLANALKTETL